MSRPGAIAYAKSTPQRSASRTSSASRSSSSSGYGSRQRARWYGSSFGACTHVLSPCSPQKRIRSSRSRVCPRRARRSPRSRRGSSRSSRHGRPCSSTIAAELLQSRHRLRAQRARSDRRRRASAVQTRAAGEHPGRAALARGLDRRRERRPGATPCESTTHGHRQRRVDLAAPRVISSGSPGPRAAPGTCRATAGGRRAPRAASTIAPSRSPPAAHDRLEHREQPVLARELDEALAISTRRARRASSRQITSSFSAATPRRRSRTSTGRRATCPRRSARLLVERVDGEDQPVRDERRRTTVEPSSRSIRKPEACGASSRATASLEPRRSVRPSRRGRARASIVRSDSRWSIATIRNVPLSRASASRVDHAVASSSQISASAMVVHDARRPRRVERVEREQPRRSRRACRRRAARAAAPSIGDRLEPDRHALRRHVVERLELRGTSRDCRAASSRRARTMRVRPSRGEPGGRNATCPSDAPDASRKRSMPPAAAIRVVVRCGVVGSGSQTLGGVRAAGDLARARSRGSCSARSAGGTGRYSSIITTVVCRATPCAASAR